MQDLLEHARFWATFGQVYRHNEHDGHIEEDGEQKEEHDEPSKLRVGFYPYRPTVDDLGQVIDPAALAKAREQLPLDCDRGLL